MKPKAFDIHRISPLANSITLSIGFAIVTATLGLDTAHATSATWDGGSGGTGTDMNVPANWDVEVLPTASGDTATWNGTATGNLVLNWTGGFGATPEATTLAITSGQTGNLTLDATGNFDLSLNSISIAASAGVFTLGDGVGTPGSSGRIVFRSDLNGVSPENAIYKNNFFTNDSSNSATWGTDLNFGASGGSPRNLVFGGTGNWTINSNLNGVGVQITKNGAGTLALTGANSTLDIVVINGGALQVNGAGQLHAGTFTGIFANAGSFLYNSSSAQTLSGIISGAGNFEKSGAGTLAFSNAANSYTGTTTINAGTLSVGTLANGLANSSLGASSNAASNLVINGGTLQLSGGSTDRNFTIGDNNATLDGAGGATITGTAAFATPDLARTLTLTGTNGAGGTGTTNFNGLLADNGTGALSLVKNGTGNWRLESANTLSGTVTLNTGGLHYGNGAAFGTATINVNGGGIVGRGAGGTLANNLLVNTDFYLGASGVGSGMGLSGNVDLGGSMRTITFPGAPITFSGIVSNGGLTKAGSSTLQLSNSGNTYAGGTVLSAGILEYTAPGALSTGQITVNGGELTARGGGGNLANNFVITGNVQLGRTGIGSGMGISGTVDLGSGTRILTTPGVNLAISGVISNGGLTKAGASTLTLTGTNTYTGTTTVNEGTLAVDGDAIPNTGTLVIDGGFVNPAGSTEQVSRLFFGDEEQVTNQTYGAVGSGADVETDEFFLPFSSGVIYVEAAGGYGAWAGNVGGQTADQDYNNDGVSNGVAYFMNDTGIISLPGIVGGAVTWINGGKISNTEYGTQYEVQTSQNLIDWDPVVLGDLTTNTSGPAGSLTYTLPTGQGKWFARLVVTPN